MKIDVHERLGRAEKARKLSDTLAGAGFSSQGVAQFNEGHWGMAAEAARVKKPSEKTQAEVVRMMRERETRTRV